MPDERARSQEDNRKKGNPICTARLLRCFPTTDSQVWNGPEEDPLHKAAAPDWRKGGCCCARTHITCWPSLTNLPLLTGPHPSNYLSLPRNHNHHHGCCTRCRRIYFSESLVDRILCSFVRSCGLLRIVACNRLLSCPSRAHPQSPSRLGHSR